MRVIAGKARSLRLKTIEGMDTRPTTDRIKETLFNMIQPSIADSRFLDLFAGSGGIGIEALSRGASWCVFVEQQRKAAECIRENLAFTRLKEDATLLVTDAVSAVNKLDGEEAFSWIFLLLLCLLRILWRERRLKRESPVPLHTGRRPF